MTKMNWVVEKIKFGLYMLGSAFRLISFIRHPHSSSSLNRYSIYKNCAAPKCLPTINCKRLLQVLSFQSCALCWHECSNCLRPCTSSHIRYTRTRSNPVHYFSSFSYHRSAPLPSFATDKHSSININFT